MNYADDAPVRKENIAEAVNPDHYKSGGIECIDIIEAKDLNFHLGNAVKYITRAGHKSDKVEQDLQKAIWYIKRQLIAYYGLTNAEIDANTKVKDECVLHNN